MTAVTLTTLTEGTIDGAGVFDKLMAATKAHLEAESKKGAIRGPEYAQVYLGQLQAVMTAAIAFLASNQKIDLEVQLLQKQIELADKELLKADAQVLLTNAQAALVQAQTENAVLEKDKTAAEVLTAQAQSQLVAQQVVNLAAEAQNIPKQGALIDAQKALAASNQAKTDAEALNVPKQGLMIDAQAALVNQQKANAVTEGTVLVAQECKLRAEFDLTVQSTTKAGKETDLLAQKIVTEQAQTTGLGVDDNSVIGRQKELYRKQSQGFDRDAEQKAVNALLQTWNTRRMTDDATVADGVNKLNDTTIGRVVEKLLTGINA